MNLNKIKEFLKKNKTILLIIGIVVLLLIIILSVVRCSSPLAGKKKVGELYYDPLDGVEKVDKKKGNYEKVIDYTTVKYTLDGMIVDVTYYQNRDVTKSLKKDKTYKEITINDNKYYYKEFTVATNYVIRHYYAQVGKDTYYVSATYKNTQANTEKIDNFINSIIINK